MEPVIRSSFGNIISRIQLCKGPWLVVLIVSGCHVTYGRRFNYRSYIVSNELGHERQI